MLKARHLWLILLVEGVTSLARGADAWEGLKLGMTADAAVTVLGAPLLRTEGRGFEIWTYENRAEVVFYGNVIAWTAPASSGSIRHVAVDWQFAQGLSDRVVLRMPVRRKDARKDVPKDAEPRTFLPVAEYGFRYRR